MLTTFKLHFFMMLKAAIKNFDTVTWGRNYIHYSDYNQKAYLLSNIDITTTNEHTADGNRFADGKTTDATAVGAVVTAGCAGITMAVCLTPWFGT